MFLRGEMARKNRQLVNAVGANNLKKVSSLLMCGADPNSSVGNGLTPLELAAQLGHLKIVKLLLDNARTYNLSKPLFLAAKHSHKEVFELLLKLGASLNPEHRHSDSLLFKAIENSDLSLVNFILQYQPNIDENVSRFVCRLEYWRQEIPIASSLNEYILSSEHGEVQNSIVMLAAVKRGNVNIVENLMASGVDPNDERYGASLLHYAVANGCVEMIKFLLRSGFDVDAEGKPGFGGTPLSLTFYHDDQTKCLEIIKVLLTHGAELKKAPGILHLAVDNEYFEICKYLIASGVDVNEPYECDDIPLQYTADFYFPVRHHKVDEDKRLEIAKLFLDNGANVNSQNERGLTTLHFAAMNGFAMLVCFLLDAKANVSSKDENWFTPLHYALKNGHKKVAEILLKRGADVNARLKKGEQSPLHIAVYKGLTDTVQLLLQFDADINAQDSKGNTALHGAVILSHPKITKTLLENNCDINIRNKNGCLAIDLLEIFDMDIDKMDYFEWTEDLDDPSDASGNQVEIASAIVNHIIKLEVARISVNIKTGSRRQINLVQSCLSTDWPERVCVLSEQNCKMELEQLKKAKLCHLTFYDLLMHYRDPFFIKSEFVLCTLRSSNFSQFPIYGNLLEYSFKQNQLAMKLFTSGQKWLKILLETRSILLQQRSPLLLDELLRKIVSYLDKKDVRSLICCGKDLKRQLSQ